MKTTQKNSLVNFLSILPEMVKAKLQLFYSNFPNLFKIFWEKGIVEDHHFERVRFPVDRDVR